MTRSMWTEADRERAYREFRAAMQGRVSTHRLDEYARAQADVHELTGYAHAGRDALLVERLEQLPVERLRMAALTAVAGMVEAQRHMAGMAPSDPAALAEGEAIGRRLGGLR